jgi:aminoglycoside phosphotransferase (APT) family kinase protein
MPGKFDFDSDSIYYFNAHRSKELVLALQKRYENFDDSIIAKLAKDALGCKVERIEPNSNFGTGHLIYIVHTNRGKVVFRGNRYLEKSEHYMALEETMADAYRSVGIPTNVMLYTDVSRTKVPFDYQFMELLPGRDLEDEFDGTKEDYDAISYRLGELVALQYKVPVKGWGRFEVSDELVGVRKTAFEYVMAYVDHDLEVMAEHGLIAQSGADEILKYIQNSKPMLDKLTQAYLVHHDIADHNIRYQEDKVMAIFDWENAVAFDPLSEIGSAHTWVCHYPRREHMTRGFLAKLGYTPDDYDARVSLYYLRTMLWKSAFALRGERFSERHYGLLRQAVDETLPFVEIKKP